MGETAVEAGRKAEGAATRAAEGSSPTGMKQLINRTIEAQQEFRALRDLAISDFHAIENAASRAAIERQVTIDTAAIQKSLDDIARQPDLPRPDVPAVPTPVVQVEVLPAETKMSLDGKAIGSAVTTYQANVAHQQSITP